MGTTSRMLICRIFVLCIALYHRWSRWILIFFIVFFLCYSIKQLRTIVGKKETTIVLVTVILLVTIYYRTSDSFHYGVQVMSPPTIKSQFVQDPLKLNLDEVWNGRKLRKSKGKENKKNTRGQNSQNSNTNSRRWESTFDKMKPDSTGIDNNNITSVSERRDKMEDFFYKKEKTCKGNKAITCSCPDFSPYQSHAGNINHIQYSQPAKVTGLYGKVQNAGASF